jgi:hypothetical protein
MQIDVAAGGIISLLPTERHDSFFSWLQLEKKKKKKNYKVGGGLA